MRMMVLIKTMVMMMMGMGMIMMMGMMIMFRQLESLCCTLGCTAVALAICHNTIEPIAREARFVRVANTLRLDRGDQNLSATQSFDFCKCQMLKLSDLIEILVKYVVLALNLAHE